MAAKEDERETVILLHGMGRSRASLWVLQARLQRAGYKTLNFPYAPHARSLDEISDALHEYIRKKVKTKRYHLVAHSLGNIIIRNGFKGEYREGLGRIVMLAPPNQPSKLAQSLKDVALFRVLFGDSGQKLSSEEFYGALPAPSAEFGVIAGDRGQRLTFDEPNDGIVAVENTKLAGMKDGVVLHHAHTFIMNAKDTAECCVRFLKEGRFGEEGGGG